MGSGYDTSTSDVRLPRRRPIRHALFRYIGDNWKIRPNLNVSLGLHYIRDTGRSDSQLGADPAINAFGAGLGDQVHQPNLNFAPQVGIAWDPWKNGKTVIRAGGGIYYENTVWNNVLFDAPARLKTGVVLGNYDRSDCGTPVSAASPSALCTRQIVAAQQSYPGGNTGGRPCVRTLPTSGIPR